MNLTSRGHRQAGGNCPRRHVDLILDHHRCPATQDAIRLDATFSADGELATGGPVTWAAIQRGKGGAIERIEGGKRAKTPVGRYRFVLR